MNKRGITLAINFVVMLVLSVAILSGSLYIIYKFFGKAEEMKLRMDSQTESEINNLLYSGEKVAIPFNHQTIKRGKFGAVGIGVLNVLRESRDFYITISTSDLPTIDCDNNPPSIMTASGPQAASTVNTDNFNLNPNQQHIELIGFDAAGIEPCTYVYNVNVWMVGANGNEYYDQRTHKIYLKIE